MNTYELIKNFKEEPVKKILYVVYDDDHINEVKETIVDMWGEDYFNQHVKITSFKNGVEIAPSDRNKFDVYVDPNVFFYKTSWYA